MGLNGCYTWAMDKKSPCRRTEFVWLSDPAALVTLQGPVVIYWISCSPHNDILNSDTLNIYFQLSLTTFPVKILYNWEHYSLSVFFNARNACICCQYFGVNTSVKWCTLYGGRKKNKDCKSISASNSITFHSPSTLLKITANKWVKLRRGDIFGRQPSFLSGSKWSGSVFCLTGFPLNTPRVSKGGNPKGSESVHKDFSLLWSNFLEKSL